LTLRTLFIRLLWPCYVLVRAVHTAICHVVQVVGLD